MSAGTSVYGAPPAALAAVAADAVQVSPLIIGAAAIEALADASLASVTVLAPPGTLERRYVLAQALRALAPGGELVALAPNDKGGARLRKELEAFGCQVREAARRHHRVCRCARPPLATGIETAIVEGGPRHVAALDMVSQPGVFSWDRLDPGTSLLLAQTWRPSGAGADLGCGYGVLARGLLRVDAIVELTLIDIDRRAIDAARRNIADPRAGFLWHDLRRPSAAVSGLDFAIMNPPFHDGGIEDRRLGHAFVVAARAMLRPGGVLRMVANVALPYERILATTFSNAAVIARDKGYKVLEARA